MKILAMTILYFVMASESAFSAVETFRGKIGNIHMNSTVDGRGLCIRMVPAISDTYACLYKNNTLYKEISALALTAYVTGAECSITSYARPAGFVSLDLLDCY